MKNYCLIHIFILLSNIPFLSAQNNITGLVKDMDTLEPIENVNIKLPDNANIVTNRKGEFSYKTSNKTSRNNFTFTCIGYKDLEEQIDILSDTIIVLMQKKEIILSEITISERKRISPIKVLTTEPLAWESSITYISSTDIERMGAVSVIDALKYSTNGLPSTQGRRKKHFYLLRGQTVASDYAINGVSLSTNGSGPMAQWVEAPTLLPANMIESIEIVRSGNSLLLGFSGLNGVVNIKTKTFDKFETILETEYGTFNEMRAGIIHGGKISDFNYAFSLFKDKTDGPKGTHSKEDFWNSYAKIGYKYKKLIEVDLENFYTYGTRFVTQAQDYRGSISPQRQLTDIWEYDPMRYNISTAKVKINETDRMATEIQLSYICNRMDLYPDTYQFVPNTTQGGTANTDSIIRHRMIDEPDSIFTLAVFQGLTPIKNNVLRIAAMYASSTTYAHGKSQKKIITGSLLDQHSFGRLDVHAGMKLIREYYDYYNPYGATSNDRAIIDKWQPILLNISTGASYNKNNLTYNIVLNTGELPVDQTALRLLTDGEGNNIVDPETGQAIEAPVKGEIRTGIDIGLDYHTHSFGHGIVTLFVLDQKNAAIFTNRAYYDENELLRYYQKNIDLQTFGIELSYTSPMFEYCSFFTNLSYKYAIEKEEFSNQKFTKQPPFIANAGVSAFYKGANVNLMGKYVSRYKTDRFLKEEVNIGDYFNFDMTASYEIPHTIFEIYGSVINIFDKRYATVSPIYPNFGRQMKIGLRASF